MNTNLIRLKLEHNHVYYIADDDRGQDISADTDMRQLVVELDRLQADIVKVLNLIDDVLYNPFVKVLDNQGNKVSGRERYLTSVPIMKDHLPALRQWFVEHSYPEEPKP